MTRIFQLITLAVVSTLAMLTLFAFTGCSDSKQAQKHFDKFIKHGGKIKPEYIYTERVDSVIVNGKTEYIVRVDSVKVDCPYQPKTRYEIRNERKSKEDSLKYALKTLKEKNAFTIDSLNKVIKLSRIQKNVRKIDAKQVIKQTKAINQKAFKWYHWVLFVIVFLLGAYLRGFFGAFLSDIKKNIQ